MQFIRSIFILIFSLFANFLFAEGESLFVLANKNVKESCELARSYCMLREIPQGNIIYLDVKNTANISRADYESKVASVVFNFLKERKMFSAMGAYPKASVLGNRAKYLVICKGVPFRISELANDGEKKATQEHNNSACLDSELALVLAGEYPIMDFQLNRSFKTGIYSAFLNQLIVSRLDGITYDDALNLAKSAIEAERLGVRGRAYVDKSKKYPEGDKWLDNSAKILTALGFDLSLDEVPACMNYLARFDAVAFYFGWYAGSPTAYFKRDDFKFVEGASGYHIYSFSASNLSNKKTWTPNLISHKVASTFGYTDEPFLFATHHPDIYMLNLAKGKTAGESAFLAMPVFSWKSMFVGDPLFSPFKFDLNAQLADIDSGKIDELSQYVIIRKMNLIAQKEGLESALSFGKPYLARLEKNYALLWKLSQISSELKDSQNSLSYAKKSLQILEGEFENNFALAGLMFEILEFLRSQNALEKFADLYAKIVRSQIGKDDDFLKSVLPILLKKNVFNASDKAEFETLNLKLNPPKPKS